MILRLCAANLAKIEHLRECLEACDIPRLSMDSKPAQLMTSIERLPILMDLLSQIKRTKPEHLDTIHAIQDDFQSIQERITALQTKSAKSDSKSNTSETEAAPVETKEDDTKKDYFSVYLDFFWIIERSAKILIQDLQETSHTEINCPYPEAFTTWSFHFTQPAVLTPLSLYQHENKNLLSLGQRYSVSDFRRCAYLSNEQLQELIELKPGLCKIDWQDFYKEYQNWLNPPILPPMKVELSHEKLESFDTLQDDFRAILGEIQNQARNNLSSSKDQTLMIWLHDPTLHQRMTMEFDHAEEVAE